MLQMLLYMPLGGFLCHSGFDNKDELASLAIAPGYKLFLLTGDEK